MLAAIVGVGAGAAGSAMAGEAVSIAIPIQMLFTRTARSSSGMWNPFRLRGETVRKGLEVTHREAEGAGFACT